MDSAAASSQPPLLGPKDLLRNRIYLLWQTRATCNGVGYTIYVGALLWLTYRLSGGIVLAGIVLAVQSAVFTLTFLISPLVDRLYDKKWVFIACYPTQAALAIVVGVTYSLGRLSVPLLLLLVILLAVLYDFTEAADQTTTRLLFGKEQLFVVSGLGSALGGAVEISMFFAGGASIAIFGALGGVYVFAFLMVGATVLAVQVRIPTPSIVPQSWWSGFKEGWRLFRGKSGRALRQLSVQQSVLGFFIAAPTLLMTLFVGKFFEGSQATYAGLYVAYVVGGIIIGLILGQLNPRRYVGPIMVGATFVLGVALLGAEVAVVSLALSLMAWLVAGLANSARNSGTWIWVQGRYEGQVLARVSMNLYLFTGVSSAVGAFAIGVLSTKWSVQLLTGVVAIGLIGTALLGLALPETRRLSY